MTPEQVTLTYLLETYKTKTEIAKVFQVSDKTVWNWFMDKKVPAGRQQQYVNPKTEKVCAWCGVKISPRTPAIFCSREHRRAMEYERAYQIDMESKKYGSHGFDSWVARSWNGSGVRGHAIAA